MLLQAYGGGMDAKIKSKRRKLTLEKKILVPLLLRIKPATFLTLMHYFWTLSPSQRDQCRSFVNTFIRNMCHWRGIPLSFSLSCVDNMRLSFDILLLQSLFLVEQHFFPLQKRKKDGLLWSRTNPTPQNVAVCTRERDHFTQLKLYIEPDWYSPLSHLSFNCRGCWGTTDDFTTSSLHFPCGSHAVLTN